MYCVRSTKEEAERDNGSQVISYQDGTSFHIPLEPYVPYTSIFDNSNRVLVCCR